MHTLEEFTASELKRCFASLHDRRLFENSVKHAHTVAKASADRACLARRVMDSFDAEAVVTLQQDRPLQHQHIKQKGYRQKGDVVWTGQEFVRVRPDAQGKPPR